MIDEKNEINSSTSGDAPKASILREVLPLFIGELAVGILTVGVFLLLHFLGVYSAEPLYAVVTGAALGIAVIVINMAILTHNVNSAIEKYLSLRGTREMTEEEADQFARENSVIIQNAMMRSYVIRTVMMVAVLVGALLIPRAFNVIAVAVPLLCYRPVMYVIELMKKRRNK
jgi:hypothetical protein